MNNDTCNIHEKSLIYQAIYQLRNLTINNFELLATINERLHMRKSKIKLNWIYISNLFDVKWTSSVNDNIISQELYDIC